MKLQENDSERGFVSGPQSRAISGLRSRLFYLLLVPVSFWLSADFCVAAAPSVEQSSAELLAHHKAGGFEDEDARNAALAVDSNLRHQLWRALISAPGDKEAAGTKSDLGQLIDQIGSVEFRPPAEAPPPEAAPKTEPNQTSAGADAPEEPPQEEGESKPPYKTISPQTLVVVEELSRRPEEAANPYELGEVLFLSGYMKEAAIFYREALNRKSADDPGSARQRAWGLFQLGNCLRHDDMSGARQAYRQLIEQYPGSLWTDLAIAQDQLLEWYLSEEPGALIEAEILQANQPTE